MSDFPLPGCLFKHMLTGQSSASSVSLQCLCWVIGWDVSDVVDEGGIGKEWERCFDRLSYDNTSKKGFSFVGWKSPSPILETSKVGQAGQGWQESTSIAAAVPVCLCVCVSLYPACCLLTLYWGEYVPLHTHTQRDDTTENKRERGRGNCSEVASQLSRHSWIYTQRGLLLQNNTIWGLTIPMLSIFQGNPPLMPSRNSVSLETKHVETYSASVVITNSATGKVQWD